MGLLSYVPMKDLSQKCPKQVTQNSCSLRREGEGCYYHNERRGRRVNIIGIKCHQKCDGKSRMHSLLSVCSCNKATATDSTLFMKTHPLLINNRVAEHLPGNLPTTCHSSCAKRLPYGINGWDTYGLSI